jgi:hypothetical protein
MFKSFKIYLNYKSMGSPSIYRKHFKIISIQMATQKKANKVNDIILYSSGLTGFILYKLIILRMV